MPRPPGDHAARRHDIAQAVLRVLATRGFAGLTMRAVAAELDAMEADLRAARSASSSANVASWTSRSAR